jgi:hypothetical protein
MATDHVDACPFPSNVKSLTPGFELLCLLWLTVVQALVGPALSGEPELVPRGSGETDPTPQGSSEMEPMPLRLGELEPVPSGSCEPMPEFLGSSEVDSTP